MRGRIEAVVFDLDGTLVDHRGSVSGALAAWLPALGATASDALLEAWIAAEERHYSAWQTRQISWPEQRRRRLRDFLPLIGQTSGDDAELDAVFAGYLRCYEAGWVGFDDVEGAVRALTEAGIRIAVLTNGTVDQQNAKIEAIGLTGRVGPVLTAEELRAAKPDPRTYAAACQRLGLPAADVLHVGDLHDLDVVGARAAGLRAVHLDRTDAGPHDETERISSLSQLPAYIAGFRARIAE